jgi:hypothetical protein
MRFLVCVHKTGGCGGVSFGVRTPVRLIKHKYPRVSHCGHCSFSGSTRSLRENEEMDACIRIFRICQSVSLSRGSAPELFDGLMKRAEHSYYSWTSEPKRLHHTLRRQPCG